MWFAHSAKVFCGHAHPQKTVPATEYSATNALANMIHKPDIKKKSASHICQPNTTNAPFSGSKRKSPDTGMSTSNTKIMIWIARRFHLYLPVPPFGAVLIILIGMLESFLFGTEDIYPFSTVDNLTQ